MNLGVLTSSVSTDAGGLYYSVPALTRHTAESCSGAQVSVLVPRECISEEDRLHWLPLEIQSFKSLGPRAYAFAPGMLPYLRRVKPSLLHVHGIWMYPTAAAYVYARKSRIPWVISPRGMLDPWALRNSAWKKKLVGGLIENRAIRAASCMHALHEGERDAFRAFGYQGPVAVIPNGVELPGDSESYPKPEAHEIRFLFLSRLHPKKRVLELLEAFQMACYRPGAPAMKLLIAGTGDEVYTRACREKATGGAVEFLGHVSGEIKSELFRHADWFVLPSHSEGLPMAVLEAWAHGCATLISPECNLSSSFTESFSHPCEGNPRVLADQLLDAAVHPPDADCRQAARKWVLTRYSWPEQGRKMAAVYQWLLGQEDCPDWVEQGE